MRAPWASLAVLGLGVASAIVMFGAIAEMSVDPRPLYFVPKPKPTPSEQYVVTPLAYCDKMGCTPVGPYFVQPSAVP